MSLFSGAKTEFCMFRMYVSVSVSFFQPMAHPISCKLRYKNDCIHLSTNTSSCHGQSEPVWYAVSSPSCCKLRWMLSLNCRQLSVKFTSCWHMYVHNCCTQHSTQQLTTFTLTWLDLLPWQCLRGTQRQLLHDPSPRCSILCSSCSQGRF